MDVNPVVPFTLEGASVLHQMMRIAWPEWNALEEDQREGIAAEFAQWLSENPRTGCYAMLGHKGDLMLVHYRDDFAGLLEAQTAIRRLAIGEFLDSTTSYVSVVELGLYESTRKIHEELAARDITPASEGWDAAVREVLDRQRKAMAPRLNPEIPETRYLCFYPMDRRRGEQKNWYMVPFADRQRMMHEHGMVGRKYAGTVKQVISGSIGFDDWEWGVDLYADDPLVFKKLIYEMRFDEVSADYALFGSFYVGLRLTDQGVIEFMQQPA